MTANASASIALLLKRQTSNPTVVCSSPRYERPVSIWPKCFHPLFHLRKGATYTCKVAHYLKKALNFD